MNITWTCHVCGQTRPDFAISVYKRDIGPEHGLPEGIMFQNVRYCNDRPTCAAQAPRVSLTQTR